jgi:hypothetical protein
MQVRHLSRIPAVEPFPVEPKLRVVGGGRDPARVEAERAGVRFDL